MVPLRSTVLEALRAFTSSGPAGRRRAGIPGRRRLASAASPSGVVISKLRLRTAASQFDEYVEIQNTSSATVDLSGWQLFDCFTSGGTPRVGTDGDPLGAGTKLPAGQTFVFGKNAGDYTGTADATYNFQVTEAGGFLIKDAGAVTQDAVGAPGTACAEGAGPDLPHHRRGLHLHPQGGRLPACRTPTTTAPTSQGRRAPPTAPRAARRARRLRPRSPSTPSRARATPRRATASSWRSRASSSASTTSRASRTSSTSIPARPGIYVETPTADQDANPATSEGIFVGGLGPADRAASHVGQTVTVSGKVTELFNLTASTPRGRTPLFSGTARPRQPARAGDDRSRPGGGAVDAGQRQRAPTTRRSRACACGWRSAPPTPAARTSSASSSCARAPRASACSASRRCRSGRPT